MKDGVFAGGDAVTGAATVIKAMGAGKKGRRCHRRIHQEQVSAYTRSAGIRRMPADWFSNW